MKLEGLASKCEMVAFLVDVGVRVAQGNDQDRTEGDMLGGRRGGGAIAMRGWHHPVDPAK